MKALNLRKEMGANRGMKDNVKASFDQVARAPAVKDLTGTEFKPVPHKGLEPVGQPTRLRGFPKTFGIVGGVASVVQAPPYMRQYGVKEDAKEILKDAIDPFGVREMFTPPKTIDYI